MLSRRRFLLPTARGTWAVARCSDSGGSHWVILWEAEAEGSLRLTPAGSPHRPAADHHLSVFGISAGIERCAYVRISSVQQQYVVYGANRSCFCTCPKLAHKFIIAPVVVVEMVKWRGHSIRVVHIAGDHLINVLSCYPIPFPVTQC